jgi:hypothetical protein|tara:strand:+ start:1519 stop:2619 length:1101 start_codon:yes stop_codon:yes gene_type:complete
MLIKLKKKKPIFIIGGGFSAAIANLYLDKVSKIISFNNNILFNKKEFIRRKSIECNKLFVKKSYSFGTLNFSLKNTILHDRMMLSGNSNIWGGKVDLTNINKKDRNFFKNKNMFFKKLSYKDTGTISNNNNIYQIQNSQNEILKFSDLPIKFNNGLLLDFFCKKKKIFLRIHFEKNNKIKIVQVNKLVLCVGSVQLLDLLYRSKLIKHGDMIEFSEFKHVFKFKSIFSKFEKKAIIVRYHISRALGHYYGIQFYSSMLKIFKFLPFCIDQIFYYKKSKVKLKLDRKTVVEKSLYKKKEMKFGESIHYCNLKINNVDINNFLGKINPNIVGLGMSFINQKKPGPISNEIMSDAKIKCKKLTIQVSKK